MHARSRYKQFLVALRQFWKNKMNYVSQLDSFLSRISIMMADIDTIKSKIIIRRADYVSQVSSMI